MSSSTRTTRRLSPGRGLDPGGVIAFHEQDLTTPSSTSSPKVPLWEQVIGWLSHALVAACPHADAGARLLGHFAAAGLPDPEVYGELLVTGRPDSPGCRLVAETARSLRPVLERIGVRAEEVDVGTLESRLRAAVVQAGAQLTSFPQYMAIARV